jgi:multidrug transporter EmrE-like cation transporter
VDEEDVGYSPPPGSAPPPPEAGPAPVPAFEAIEEQVAAPPSARPDRERQGRAKARRRGGFLRVPPGLDDQQLEALRLKVMQRSILVIGALFVVAIVGPMVLGLFRFPSDIIGPVGVVDFVLIGVLYTHARRVGRASKKQISATERLALSRVKSGGWVLALIPLIGSVFGQFGLFFQTSPMHPIYYLIAGAGIVITLSGVTTLKERYSYYNVFEFGLVLLLLHPLPALLPAISPVLGNAYWFQTTFLFLAIGFILMSFALRKMRAGQHEALEAEMRAGDEALASSQFDRAITRYDRAVTISHSLFSDKLFKSTRSGQRALPPDYYEPWVGKANALARSGRGPKALAILDLILEVDSTNASLWMNKGDVLLTLDRPAEAYIAFEQAERITPQAPNVAQRKQSALDRIQRRMG